jgi:hypothetical protein
MLYVDDPAHAEQALALRDTESGASFVLAADYALATSHVATILHHTGDRSWLGGHTQARKRNGDSGVARIRPSASSRTLAFAPSDPQIGDKHVSCRRGHLPCVPVRAGLRGDAAAWLHVSASSSLRVEFVMGLAGALSPERKQRALGWVVVSTA